MARVARSSRPRILLLSFAMVEQRKKREGVWERQKRLDAAIALVDLSFFFPLFHSFFSPLSLRWSSFSFSLFASCTSGLGNFFFLLSLSPSLFSFLMALVRAVFHLRALAATKSLRLFF